MLVCGKPDSDEGELVDNLIKDAKNNESSVVSKGTEVLRKQDLSTGFFLMMKKQTYQGWIFIL